MRTKEVEVVVIGAGAGGLEAAIAARRSGAANIIVLERDERLGGILHQCIHNGFGLYRYREELTGPEYIARVLTEFHKLEIPYRTNAMVLDVTPQKKVCYVHPSDGLVEVKAKAVILAMGCREKTRYMIRVPGDRPAGIYTAGTAQRLMNIDGILPGREVVVVGSGDIGLIMARRCTLSGMLVKAVVEILPYPNGLIRNVVQCLYDFELTLLLSTRVNKISGRKRVEGVVVTKIDEGGNCISGTELGISCDTVLVAAGLVPENELSRKAGVKMSSVSGGPEIDQNMETSVAGIFSAGDVTYIHNLADYVSQHGETAGMRAVELHTCAGHECRKSIQVECGPGISFVAPQRICLDGCDTVDLDFRVTRPEENARVRVVNCAGDIFAERKFRYLQPSQIETITVNATISEAIRILIFMSTKIVCISCPLGCLVEVDKNIISGYKCQKGKEYAYLEATNPIRIFTGSVRIKDGDLPVLSVRSTSGVPKSQIKPIASVVRRIVVNAPVQMGHVVLADVLDTGVDLVATRTVTRISSY